MKLRKESVQNFVKAIVFLLILAVLFVNLTYLFRNTNINTRGTVLHYYNEPEDSLDVVLIGASNIMRYWDPMRAWNSYGLASYDYAPSGMTSSTHFAALKDALETQTPKLVILEIRKFISNDALNLDYARRLLDSHDVNFSRFQDVRYYCDAFDVPMEEALPLYIDLMYYHNNYDALFNAKNWDMADNRIAYNPQANKGYYPFEKTTYFADPRENLSQEVMPLDDINQKFLVDILEYCQEREIQLLLVASPMVITQKESQRLNAVAQLAEEYGVPFLDTNLYYEQMGLDFSGDFSDAHHTNVLGADKFTDFLGNYLAENYDLPDRRNDPAYEAWHVVYENYREDSDVIREKASAEVTARNQALENGEKLRKTKNPLQWLSLADNDEFTLFILGDNPAENAPSLESRLVMKHFGVEGSFWKRPFALVFNEKIKQRGIEKSFTGKVGAEELSYTISAKDAIKIQIDGTDYTEGSPEGIYIVVFNNSLSQVVDQITLTVTPDGSLAIQHK